MNDNNQTQPKLTRLNAIKAAHVPDCPLATRRPTEDGELTLIAMALGELSCYVKLRIQKIFHGMGNPNKNLNSFICISIIGMITFQVIYIGWIRVDAEN